MGRREFVVGSEVTVTRRERHKKVLFYCGIVIVVLNAVQVALTGLHLNVDSVIAILMIVAGGYGISQGLKGASEESRGTRWWNNARRESFIIPHMILMPPFLWFVCHKNFGSGFAIPKVTVFILALLLIETVLARGLKWAREYEEEATEKAVGGLFDSRIFSLIVATYLTVGTLLYFTPKAGQLDDDSSKDLKALDRSLDEMKRSIARDGK